MGKVYTYWRKHIETGDIIEITEYGDGTYTVQRARGRITHCKDTQTMIAEVDSYGPTIALQIP